MTKKQTLDKFWIVLGINFIVMYVLFIIMVAIAYQDKAEHIQETPNNSTELIQQLNSVPFDVPISGEKKNEDK